MDMIIEVAAGIILAAVILDWLRRRAAYQELLAERKAHRKEVERQTQQCKDKMETTYAVLQKSSAAYIAAAKAALGENYWWLNRKTLLEKAPHLRQLLLENDRAQADYEEAERAWSLDGGADPKEYDKQLERDRQYCREGTRRYIEQCEKEGYNPYEMSCAASICIATIFPKTS